MEVQKRLHEQLEVWSLFLQEFLLTCLMNCINRPHIWFEGLLQTLFLLPLPWLWKFMFYSLVALLRLNFFKGFEIVNEMSYKWVCELGERTEGIQSPIKKGVNFVYYCSCSLYLILFTIALVLCIFIPILEALCQSELAETSPLFLLWWSYLFSLIWCSFSSPYFFLLDSKKSTVANRRTRTVSPDDVWEAW